MLVHQLADGNDCNLLICPDPGKPVSSSTSAGSWSKGAVCICRSIPRAAEQSARYKLRSLQQPRPTESLVRQAQEKQSTIKSRQANILWISAQQQDYDDKAESTIWKTDRHSCFMTTASCPPRDLVLCFRHQLGSEPAVVHSSVQSLPRLSFASWAQWPSLPFPLHCIFRRHHQLSWVPYRVISTTALLSDWLFPSYVSHSHHFPFMCVCLNLSWGSTTILRSWYTMEEG